MSLKPPKDFLDFIRSNIDNNYLDEIIKIYKESGRLPLVKIPIIHPLHGGCIAAYDHPESLENIIAMEATSKGRGDILFYMIENYNVDIHLYNDILSKSAAGSGDLLCIELLLRRGGSRCRDAMVVPALMKAFPNQCYNTMSGAPGPCGPTSDDRQGKIDLVTLLLREDKWLLIYLLKNGIKITDNLRYYLKLSDDPELRKYIKEKSKILNNLDLYNKIIRVSSNGKLEKLRELCSGKIIPKNIQEKAFIHSAYGGRLDILKFWVDRDINISSDDNGAICGACFTNSPRHMACVQYLLDKGVDFSARNGLCLVYACQSGNRPLVEQLVKLGLNKDQLKSSCLIVAKTMNRQNIIDFLNS